MSGGSLVLKRADIISWRGNTEQIDGRAVELLGGWHSYGALYRQQPWIAAPVNKIASATARLPLKVYRRGESREDARGTPYGKLLGKPSSKVDPFTFWTWVRSTLDIYGESFLGKVRDRGGRPVELVRLHPAHMQFDDEKAEWSYDDGKRRIKSIPRRDFVHFRFFNPDSERGLSPLEPLRSTLENEEGARRANSALWRNGGRPSVTLQHPGKLSEAAGERLARQWAEIHGGVDNWAKALVLEENMTANAMTLNVEELQYIEARKLNREECCAVYDIPPPVLHILDNATYSNITEQMRSMYRDTMGPKLGHLESTLDLELRDGSMGTGREPDFPPELYAEFLMDEVLRGDFEVRAQAYSAGINAGWLQPAEVRQMENKPFVDGSDVLLVNSTLVPVDQITKEPEPPPPVVEAAPEPPPALPAGNARALNGATLRTLMGRLSRKTALDEIDPTVFVAGLTEGAGQVLKALADANERNETVDQFKARLKNVLVPETVEAAQPVFISHTVVNPDKEIPATVVNNHMDPPVVNVAPTEVNVPAPEVTVNVPAPLAIRRVVERDENGRIVALVDTPI